MTKDEIIDKVFEEYNLCSGVHKDACRIILNRYDRELLKNTKEQLQLAVVNNSGGAIPRKYLSKRFLDIIDRIENNLKK